jgi:hypothetical protein
MSLSPLAQQIKREADAIVTRILAQSTAPAQQPTTHPMRCAATTTVFHGSYDRVQHPTHNCTHPAALPVGVIGLPEHLCSCGMTWVETVATAEES